MSAGPPAQGVARAPRLVAPPQHPPRAPARSSCVLAEKRYAEAKGSLFALLQMPAVLLSSVGALFVGHRLVVREYGQRTQLFLEALPLSRTRILTTKLVLGAAVLLLPLAADLPRPLEQGRGARGRHRPLRPPSAPFARPPRCCWAGAFFALAGLLGRYRNPLYVILAIAAFAADHLTELDLSKTGPFALLGADFAFERHRIPWEQPRCVLGPHGGGGGALLRAGPLPGRNPGRAVLPADESPGEGVHRVCLRRAHRRLFPCWTRRSSAEPFALHEAEQSPSEGARPSRWPPGWASRGSEAQALAERLAEELLALSDYLGLERLPAVAVLPIRELDADVFQRAKLEKADGVVVRANLAAPDFDPRAFEAFLFREVLIQVSEGVVLREERQWLLDGFTTWWANRSRQERAAVGEGRGGLSGRLRHPGLVDHARAPRSLPVGSAGRPGSARRCSRRLGEPSFRALMRRTLAQPPGTGLWGLWREPRLASLLREQDGFSEEELSAALVARRSREDRETHAKELERLAGMTPSLTLVAESAETFRLEHTLQAAEGQALPARYALLHQQAETLRERGGAARALPAGRGALREWGAASTAGSREGIGGSSWCRWSPRRSGAPSACSRKGGRSDDPPARGQGGA